MRKTDIMERLAQNSSMDISEVRNNIDTMIDILWNEENTQAVFAMKKHFGHKPTAEEYLLYLAQIMKRDVEESV